MLDCRIFIIFWRLVIHVSVDLLVVDTSYSRREHITKYLRASVRGLWVICCTRFQLAFVLIDLLLVDEGDLSAVIGRGDVVIWSSDARRSVHSRWP